MRDFEGKGVYQQLVTYEGLCFGDREPVKCGSALEWGTLEAPPLRRLEPLCLQEAESAWVRRRPAGMEQFHSCLSCVLSASAFKAIFNVR